MKKILSVLMFCFIGIANADDNANIGQISEDVFGGDLSQETALAYDKTFTYDLSKDGIKKVSAVVEYGSATLSAKTFTSGRTSAGTITVLSTSSLCGHVITVHTVKFNMGGCPPYDSRTATKVTIGASTAAAAANLLTAIKADTVLADLITGTTSYNIISLTSKLADGVAYALTTTGSSVTVSAAAMASGQAATYNATTDIITITGHAFTTALPVLYNVGSAPAITGLTNQTTYYAVPITANTIYLATTSALAQAGVYHANMTVQLSSATAGTYTLTPLNITGTPGFKWQLSNDDTKYFNVDTTSVTISEYTNPYASVAYNLGNFNYRYLRLNVTGPTTGGILLNTWLYLKR